MDRRNIQISIDGMSCGHCVKTVREALESVPGVTVGNVEIGRANVTVEEEVQSDVLEKTIDDTGFVVRSISSR